MFIQMKEYKQKYDKLDNLKARIESNKKRKKEVLVIVIFIMNCITFTKINTTKKIDTLSAENKNLLDNKQLRLSDYTYLSEEDEEEQKEQKSTKVDYKTLNKHITDEKTDVNNEIFRKYFKVQRPSDMLVLLNRTDDTEKNNKLVNLINSGLKDLKEDIKKMSEAEIENEDPKSIVNIVEKILKFNKQNQQKGARFKNTNTKPSD